MPVSVEVMELVQLLQEEGFGPLAGELLTEISLGREIDDEEPDTGRPLDSKQAAGRFADAPPPREPIPEHEQLAVAAEFLRLRLVEPVRRLAEAERIAGALVHKPHEPQASESGAETRSEEPDPVRIQFNRASDDDRPSLERTEQEGRAETADKLAALLEQLVRASG